VSTRRGRPSIDDDAALRQAAEHIVDAEERGERRTARAAILRAIAGRSRGHSPDATVRRLQRKWRQRGQHFLAEVREHAMNDPHVVSLTYLVKHSDIVDFKKARPLTVDTSAFRVTIDAGRARVEMLEHFATEQEALAMVEPFLRAWELRADLQDPSDRVRFVYERPEVIDRAPSGDRIVRASGVGSSISSGWAKAHVSRAKWPEAPSDLAMSLDAEALHQRWLGYLDKKEPLLSAAYWALTMIEAAPGAAGVRCSSVRKDASRFFNIELDVLKKLGELTSTRGGVEEGRKAEGRATPLSRSERKWLAAAFKRLVERAALRAHYGAPPPTPLAMQDLPDLMP
jgi:hypothetical protein